MRLLRVGPAGAERPAALLDDDQVVSLSSVVDDLDGPTLSHRMTDIAAALADPSGLPTVDLSSSRVGAPIARPGKVVCIGLNYRDHALEAGLPVPDEPVVFLKASQCVIGPYDDVRIPRRSEKTDWEVELAVVIGRECRYLADEDEARAAIAGYAVSNDVSERHFQLERGGQWDKGKCCETFNPLGPWLVTPDDVDDVQGLAMTTIVNGERRQSGSTATMVFDVAFVVHYLSQFMVLEPGDVVNTGTPPGVGMGMRPPSYLKAGDVMELSIAGLGTQRQVCVPAP